MWNRSAADKKTGLMTVVVTDWNGDEFFRGQYSDVNEANAAGEQAEREMTNAMNMGPAVECDMTDDELLAELTGF
jgi:hypothetical protein|tara:strand:- start:503 stop:727 length:225 start_codon:yes stop_codon:yes gene_type:complete